MMESSMKRKGFYGSTFSTSNIHGGSSTTGHTSLNNGMTTTRRGINELRNKKSSSEVRKVHIDSLLYEKRGPHMEYYCPDCNHLLTEIMVRDTTHRPYDTVPHPHRPDDLTFRHYSFHSMIPSIHGAETNGARNSHLSYITRLAAISHAGSTKQSGNKIVEILKSIVYGGLTESVTSLGIVISAASAHASTLSIVALALANLIGGLFTIGHNLWQLKNDESKVPSEETTDQVYKYEEVLGKKYNFFLHAVFAILSFLVFGSVPPMVYGFSFRESDNRDLKIAAVGIASLACITLLAIAKAFIQRPPKYIKTVTYYIALGFGVSCLSYAAGDLVNKLLEELGLFPLAGAPNTVLSLPAGMGTVKPSWQSY